MIKPKSFRVIEVLFIAAAAAAVGYWLAVNLAAVSGSSNSSQQNLPSKIGPDSGQTEVTPTESKTVIPERQANAALTLEGIDMLLAAKDTSELKKILSQFGPEKTMADLLTDSGGGALADCHQEAHNIGRLAYEVFGASVFKDGNSSCHSGYYHGAIEAFLNEKGTAELVRDIEAVCDSFETAFGRFECLHGIGHGVLAYENYEMPAAIRICGSLATDYDQASCYGGMFMENIVTAQGRGAGQVHETSWANLTDPHFPCNGIGDDYSVRYQCYQMQTSWMLTIFNYNFDQVKDECLKAPEDMRLVCFKSFGRDAAGHTLRDVDKIAVICDKVFSYADYYRECIHGAVNVIVDFWGDGLKNQATELCKKVSEDRKLNCYQTLGWRLSDVFKSDENRRAVCAGFEEGYRYICVH